MLDAVLQDIREKAAAWEKMVTKQRAISIVNPIADAVEYCAKDLRALADTIEEQVEEITPEQFARLHKVSAETVRSWIRKKRIPARGTAKGYLIRRDTAPPLRCVG